MEYDSLKVIFKAIVKIFLNGNGIPLESYHISPVITGTNLARVTNVETPNGMMFWPPKETIEDGLNRRESANFMTNESA
jgi:hypothetical protein